mgnify:CR=1 FL=1
MKNAKWRSIELNEHDAVKFKEHLYKTNLKFETSGCFELVHFEVLTTPEEARKLNDYLDREVFKNAIVEKR